jgi:hypothetical protein
VGGTADVSELYAASIFIIIKIWCIHLMTVSYRAISNDPYTFKHLIQKHDRFTEVELTPLVKKTKIIRTQCERNGNIWIHETTEHNVFCRAESPLY